MKKQRIGIIGAGIGGIASAIRMAAKGYEVDVFEGNEYPGGKLTEIVQDGFRFDAGPSLFTMPQYVDELFELLGENPKDSFQYEALNTICHYFWEDGTQLSSFADKEKFAQELEEKLNVPTSTTLGLLGDSARKYELIGEIFLTQSLHKFATWRSKKVLKAIFNLHRLSLFSTMHQANKKRLKNPKATQFFDRFATYNGSNPYKCPSILNIIPHYEHHFGAYFPRGGMHKITLSLYQLAKRNGVRFHFNHKVKEIITDNKKTIGIKVNNETKKFDKIISNMDVYHTYHKLLPNINAPKRILSQERSSSALIFYWGIKASFKELGLHNIFFSDHYQKEFECLEKGTIYHDPTIYINISSKKNPSDAPEGCENWFVMINVPANNGQDWESLKRKAKNNILQKISRCLNKNINHLIQCESVLDPIRIEANTSSYQGALYGTSSNSKLAAALRHANFSRQIEGLYFCGGSVHPGGGIPLSLLSAKIIADVME